MKSLTKGLLYSALGLGIFTTVHGCGSASGYQEGFVAGQEDISHFLESRIKNLEGSFTREGLEQYLQLNLRDLQQNNGPVVLESPLYKEVIASFLALQLHDKTEK